ncbi:non-ribosomal peptide synthetase [Belnapia rosea]|uniref:non-ribosomal peptide synthetase n=1 Tax=Belnapia rosea TaxID=938405 RepID=UPI00088CD143|nr:non-ribosomal peptide synthetase [Belnapia rosea]SDB28685.1 amino acid adenylation domain-containing protein [Belnapia rosea]
MDALPYLDAASHSIATGCCGPDDSGLAGTIQAAFRQQAAATPRATALLSDQGAVTYGELDAQTDRIAQGLRRRGVKDGDLVGMLVQRSPDAIAAMIGILKAGAAYVPLDPGYPTLILDGIREECAPAALVCDSISIALCPAAASWSMPRLNLSADAAEIAALAAAPVETAVQQDPLAYVMYTSGSTGRPKGVMVPHRGVLRLVCSADYVRLASDEVLLQLCSLTFDVCVFEIYGALLNGGTLAVPDPQPSLDDIAEAIARFGVTTLWLTSGLFTLMVDHRPDALAPLRQLLAGGDIVSSSHVARLQRVAPACQIINGYGPTENTVFTTCYTIPHGWDGQQPVPIGKAIAGTGIMVLDEEQQPVPVGEAGELCTNGLGVALGYLKRPELTAEKFIPHPTRPGSTGTVYRTGDLVRLRADGLVEFLGRIDRQIKINGKRIELDGIEAALRSMPQVRDAAVVAPEPIPGRKRIVAYVVADASPGLAETILRQAREVLPLHMVPADVLMLDRLPLSRSGKVDRKALPAYTLPAAAVPATRTRPSRSTAEVMLSEIWCRVLHLPQVDVQANFLDLGGTSLQAFEVHEGILRAFGRDLPITDLFAQPTIVALARHLSADAEATGASSPSSRAQGQAESLRRLAAGRRAR